GAPSPSPPPVPACSATLRLLRGDIASPEPVACFQTGNALPHLVVVDTASLTGHVLLPVAGEGGRALAVFLQPQSRYDLHRLDQMQLALAYDALYPVLRVFPQER
ncbi:MAG: hypothetical protein ACR2HK_05260, partial [Gemmatimonadales bacterium]